MKNLVIVESPAKARTIGGFLGKDFLVKSCFGHIRDLEKGNDAVDIENSFAPHYEIPDEKKQVVAELKRDVKAVDMVWLASDEDREGEAIAWHLSEVLNLNKKDSKRIVFHEITKTAITEAVANPRAIDINLVNAQQARRILDRLVGYELSATLWKKVKPALSAGRVQSVAVRLIVEREREINAFNASSAFKISAYFFADNEKNLIVAELPKKFSSQEDAERFLHQCIGAIFKVKAIAKSPLRRYPAPPFTTSTLQQEASRKLGYSVSRTMTLAQQLYELGHITYMRTDSVNLSNLALVSAKKEISESYGEKYVHTRQFTTKSKSAQEAHEAIRPTHFDRHTISGEYALQRLYDLIWKRAIASQMSEAELEKTTINITISTISDELIATGEVLLFDGFLKVYLEGKDDDVEEQVSILPPLIEGQVVQLQSMAATQKFTRPPARYTEASLVKRLEENGIGRPSTYAPTISTIMKRGYVVKEDREGVQREIRIMTLKDGKVSHTTQTETTGTERGKLFPSDIGMVVTDFLSEHFRKIMDYQFTATVEEEFDQIAQGELEWVKMLQEFYSPFHKTVDKTLDKAERVSGERELGMDPKSGKTVKVRIGRYGPLAQIGENTEEHKAQMASLHRDQSLETITLAEALELFKLPRVAGEFEEKEMKVAVGRYGPYILFDNKFYSIPRDEDPIDLTQERAVEIIKAKREADANKTIKVFPDNLQVLNGRYGPYIRQGKENYKIPKDVDPKMLSLEEVQKIIADVKANPPKKRYIPKSKRR